MLGASWAARAESSEGEPRSTGSRGERCTAASPAADASQIFALPAAGTPARRSEVPCRPASWHHEPRARPVSAVHNVHRPEKLDWGFLSVVILLSRVLGLAIEVLRAVAAHSDVVLLQAGPCISDTMSLRAACSVLGPLRAAGAVGHLASSTRSERAPHGRAA